MAVALSRYYDGSDSGLIDTRTSWKKFLDGGAGLYLLEADPEQSAIESLTGEQIALVWAEIALDTGTVVYAKVDLPDPATYYGGFKFGRLLGVGQIKRSLSDRMGNYEAAEFSVLLSDADRVLRGFLGTSASKWFLNRFVTIRMISDQGRRALDVPRVVALGYLRDYAPISPLQFSIQCEDYLALFVGLGQNENQIPKRTLERTDFPNLPAPTKGKPVPIIYGTLSDEASTDVPPVLIAGDRGGYLSEDGIGGRLSIVAGYGRLPVTVTPPTSVLVTAVAAGGVIPDVPGAFAAAVIGAPGATTYTYSISAYNGFGESAKFADQVIVGPDVLDNTNYIELTWTLPAGAPVGYVIYGRTSSTPFLTTVAVGALVYTDDLKADPEKTAPPAAVATSSNLATDIPNAEYGIIVTAVDAAGNESDPYSFSYNHNTQGSRGSFPSWVPKVTVGVNQKIQVSWSGASASAVKYRVYLGWFYYSSGFGYYLEIDAPATSCEFTHHPGFGIPYTDANITPGAIYAPYSARWLYAVTAVMASGAETAMSQQAWGTSYPYRRPIRIDWEWQGVGVPIEYRVYRKLVINGTWDRMWTVPASRLYFEDDLLDTGVTILTTFTEPGGIVPVIPVGDTAIPGSGNWKTFVVCGHAVKAIDQLFVDRIKVTADTYGQTWLVPGTASWTALVGPNAFVDLNGRRYTVIYGRGPQADQVNDGTSILTLNIDGIEDVGNGTGALITDGFAQYLHAMRNWILQSYQGGAWFATGTPTWPATFGVAGVGVLDDASFTTASNVAKLRIAGGYTGAFMIGANGAQETVRTWVQRFNLSLDAFAGFTRKSQFFVVLIDTSSSIFVAAQKFTQSRDIFTNSFRIVDRPSDMENVISYNFGRDYTKGDWKFDTQEVLDTLSITNALQRKISQTIDLWTAPTAGQALDVASRRLARTKLIPRTVTFTTGLQALDVELGDLIKVTHLEGIGASGWQERPVFVTRHELDPDKLEIVLEGLDVFEQFAGAFILGDETALAATWAAATAANKLYGYLCDVTTEVFANGELGKRLR